MWQGTEWAVGDPGFSVQGRLGTHSIMKLASTSARERGTPKDDFGCRA